MTSSMLLGSSDVTTDGGPAPTAIERAKAYENAFEAARCAAGRYVARLDGLPVASMSAPPAPLPPDGVGFEQALALALGSIEPWLSASTGPRYLGFVTGGATPEAIAAEWLATTWDQNVSGKLGSIAADVEARTVDALADLFGLPARLGGHFVSGATAANTVALATAREWAAERSARPPLVFAGAAHSSILKAMAITGIGRDRLRPVATLPDRTAVDPAALNRALAAHEGPAVIVASAGEVNTGDFDDLKAVAALAELHGAWLHVDGAFGLFAALDDELKAKVAGVDRANSVTVDLHKWLNVPYDSAIAFTTRPDLQRSVFGASSAYLGDAPDPLHYTPENSRRFRAFPAWMVLATRGRRGIAAWVRENCRQARAFGVGLASNAAFEVVGGVHLNIVSFALRTGTHEERDALLARINGTGDVFMTPSQVLGRPVIRAAFSNWRTGMGDVDRILGIVLQSAVGMHGSRDALS